MKINAQQIKLFRFDNTLFGELQTLLMRRKDRKIHRKREIHKINVMLNFLSLQSVLINKMSEVIFNLSAFVFAIA